MGKTIQTPFGESEVIMEETEGGVEIHMTKERYKELTSDLKEVMPGVQTIYSDKESD